MPSAPTGLPVETGLSGLRPDPLVAHEKLAAMAEVPSSEASSVEETAIAAMLHEPYPQAGHAAAAVKDDAALGFDTLLSCTCGGVVCKTPRKQGNSTIPKPRAHLHPPGPGAHHARQRQGAL